MCQPLTRRVGSLSSVALLAACINAATTASVAAGAINYTYDTLGRISQAVYPGSVTVTFNYDAAGNRSSYVVTGSPNSPPAAPTPIGQAKPITEPLSADKDQTPR